MKAFRILGLLMALLLAVFTAPPAHAVMGTCTVFALAVTNTAIPVCSATVTTACLGGLPAQGRKHLEFVNPSAIEESVNFGAAVVSLQGLEIPPGARVIVFDATNFNYAGGTGQPGTTTGINLGPTGAVNAIAASATPNITACEW